MIWVNDMLAAIGLLCHISTGVNTQPALVYQIDQQSRCQKYYAECIEKYHIAFGLYRSDTLLKCIKEQYK